MTPAFRYGRASVIGLDLDVGCAQGLWLTD